MKNIVDKIKREPKILFICLITALIVSFVVTSEYDIKIKLMGFLVIVSMTNMIRQKIQ